MKELSTEEKAKAYDRVSKEVKDFFEGRQKMYSDVNQTLEYLFPELKESEDERMLNHLHSWMKEFSGAEEYTEKVYNWIRGLIEKQGEKKPTDLPNGEDYGIDGLWHAISILERTRGKVDGYQTDDGILEHECAISAVKKLYEQKPWSEEDENYFNAIISIIIKNQSLIKLDDWDIDWLKSLKYRVQAQPKQEWNEEDKANLDYLIDFCNGYYNGNKPVLTESTARSLSNWLYRLKSCEIISKPNKIDNEEVEKTIHLACEFIRHRMESNGNIGGVDYAELIKRLQSLRERYTWKPSEEQIKALERAMRYCPETETLKDAIYILEQLKKLKG